MIKSEERKVNSPPRGLRLLRSHIRFCETDEPEKRRHGFRSSVFNLLPYGIGVIGRGATPQMADAQGGRGGVGIRVLFPCVAAVPPVMQVPV
jgi:hypothetical protein